MKRPFKKTFVLLLVLTLLSWSTSYGGWSAFADTPIEGSFNTAKWQFYAASGVLRILPGDGHPFDSQFGAGQGTWAAYKDDITKIIFDGPIKANVDSSKLFFGLKKLTTIEGLNQLDTSDVENMHMMFYNCKDLQSLDLSGFNTSNVTTMKSMFYSCKKLEQLDLSAFDLRNVTTMNAMFYRCTALKTVQFSEVADYLNTANLTSMRTLFYQCNALQTVDLSRFDMSAITSLHKSFYQCSALKSVDFSSSTANPNGAGDSSDSCEGLFYDCSELERLDISNIDTTGCNTTNLLKNTPKLSYLKLGSATKLPGAELAAAPTDAVYNGKWLAVNDAGSEVSVNQIMNAADPTGIYIWGRNETPTVTYQFESADATAYDAALDGTYPTCDYDDAQHVASTTIGAIFVPVAPQSEVVTVTGGRWFFVGYLPNQINPVERYQNDVVGKWQFKQSVVNDDPSDDEYVRVTFEAGDYGATFTDAVDDEVWALKGTLASAVFSYAQLAYDAATGLNVPAGFSFEAYRFAIVDTMEAVDALTAVDQEMTYIANYQYRPTVITEQITVGDDYDLTDNISPIPSGTMLTDVTTAGAIDVATAGTYHGVIKVVLPNGVIQFVEVPLIVSADNNDDDGDDTDDTDGSDDGDDTDGSDDGDDTDGTDDGDDTDDTDDTDGTDDTDDTDDADGTEDTDDADDDQEGWILTPNIQHQDTDTPSNHDDQVVREPHYMTSLRGFSYIVGYPDGNVRPDDYLTRAEVATVFFRLLASQIRVEQLVETSSFSDVRRSDWFSIAVATLEKLDIIQGYPDGSFRPQKMVSRAQFSSLLARFAQLKDRESSIFSDAVGHWAEVEISRVAAKGWIEGYQNQLFKPNQPISRAEAMTIINRMLNLVPQNKDDLLSGMLNWPDNQDQDSWYYLAVQTATNSHVPEWRQNGFEKWRRLTPNYDWTNYQK